MSQPSYFVMALGVLNLLLAAAGLLLVFFDWSAARRREFLYLYFTEEKPGANYFYSAKRRRAQFSRLIAAFAVILLQQIIASWVYASASDPLDYAQWINWWQTGAPHPSINLAVTLYPWIYYFEIFGLGLLAFGILYPASPDHSSRHDMTSAIFVALWAIFVAIDVLGFVGNDSTGFLRYTSLAARTALVIWVIWRILRSRDEDSTNHGLLRFDPMMMVAAFGAWWVGHTLGDLYGSPLGAAMGMLLALVPIILTIARGVIGEYETVESSRHRMGRERAVIFSFLQRIGAAFTTSVEVDEVLRIVAESALETTEASAGAIYLYHAETKKLEPRVVLNFFPPLYVDSPASSSGNRTEELEEEMRHQSFALDEGVIGEVAQSGQGRIIRDVREERIMLGSTTEYMRNRSMLLVPLRIRDEPLGVMAVLNKQRGSFGRDDQSLLQALADQGALSINYAMLTNEVRQQERLRRELQIARDIQQHLLPDKCPEIPGFQIAGRATSATEVGGDYYDFVPIDDDHMGIVVADVSGKGVHAALVVAMIRSAFRTQARNNTDVRDVLAGVNEFISQDLPQNMFITCVYGILEISSRTFSWARAGHEPLLVAHQDAPTELLSPEGFALGVIGSEMFREMLEVKSIQLKSGDRLLIFTDGLTEAMNASGEEFGMERILDAMDHHVYGPPLNGHAVNGSPDNIAHADGGSSEFDALASKFGFKESEMDSPCAPSISIDEPEDLKSIERAVHDHVGDAPQSDDLTIVYLAAT
jgi:sigma-B regulation protein RsbU (phosphoserine phosphatase)